MWNAYLLSDPAFKLNDFYRLTTAYGLKLLVLETTEYYQEREGKLPPGQTGRDHLGGFSAFLCSLGYESLPQIIWEFYLTNFLLF